MKEKALKAKRIEAEEDMGRMRGRDGDGPGSEAPKRKHFLTQGGGKEGDFHMIKRMINVVAIFVEAVNTSSLDAQGRGTINPHDPLHLSKVAKAEAVEGTEREESALPSSSTTEGRQNDPAKKGLLEEATKVLKSISSSSTSTAKPAAGTSDSQRN